MIPLSRALCRRVVSSPAYQRYVKGSACQDGLLFTGRINDALSCSFPGYSSSIIATNLAKRPELCRLTGCKLIGTPRRWAKYVNEILNRFGWVKARNALLNVLYASYKPDQIAIHGIPTLTVFEVSKKAGPVTIGTCKMYDDWKTESQKCYEVIFMVWPEVEMN